MKFLAITALFIAGALAVPANPCNPPKDNGGDHGGYGGDHDHKPPPPANYGGGQYPPPSGGDKYPPPSNGDKYPPPPDGGNYPPHHGGGGDGDGDGDEGNDNDDGGHGGHGGHHGSNLCPAGLLTNPLCCDVSVLGLVSLNCSPPDETPSDVKQFTKICKKGGRKAQCCAIPVAGQSLLCQDVASN